MTCLDLGVSVIPIQWTRWGFSYTYIFCNTVNTQVFNFWNGWIYLRIILNKTRAQNGARQQLKPFVELLSYTFPSDKQDKYLLQTILWALSCCPARNNRSLLMSTLAPNIAFISLLCGWVSPSSSTTRGCKHTVKEVDQMAGGGGGRTQIWYYPQICWRPLNKDFALKIHRHG